MKKKIFALFLVLATFEVIYLPTQAKAFDINDNTSLVRTVTTNFNRDVRYVRIRGKRYKVWYKVYYRRGRRYVRIQRVVRA